MTNKPCSQIENVDFKNASFSIEESASPIQFRDGKACLSVLEGRPCVWEYKITTDRVLHPDPLFLVRLIVVNANHLIGSGAWDYVMLIACENGKLLNLLESKYLYGAKLQITNDRQLVITSGKWEEKDPNCCPSQEQEDVFQWNSRKHIYIVTKSTIRRRTIR